MGSENSDNTENSENQDNSENSDNTENSENLENSENSETSEIFQHEMGMSQKRGAITECPKPFFFLLKKSELGALLIWDIPK